MVSKHHLDPPAEQVDQRGRPAAIRHMEHVDAGHHLEQLAEHVEELPLPPDAKLSLPGLALA